MMTKLMTKPRPLHNIFFSMLGESSYSSLSHYCGTDSAGTLRATVAVMPGKNNTIIGTIRVMLGGINHSDNQQWYTSLELASTSSFEIRSA